MFRSLACCCGGGGSADRTRVPVENDEEDWDYLLGGRELEWDSHSRRFTRRAPTTASGSRRAGYVPPALPNSTVTPTIDDFRLLKTVGKGAFGKVFLPV